MATKIIPVPKSVRNDLTGRRFGRWMVLGYVGASPGRASYWLCRCDCGTERAVHSSRLRSGDSQACGCRRTSPNLSHGKWGTPEYNSWAGMLRRCTTPTNPKYPEYGGRGIKVCQRWNESFQAFYDDMGPRPSSAHSLDRIDNDGDYEPSNCRWATRAEQQSNRRVNHLVTYNGETLTVKQWAEKMGISEVTLLGRLRSNWPVKRALTEPVRKRKR